VGWEAGEGVIMRWGGLRWKEDRAPGLPDAGTWYSVGAASPWDVWAYGWGGEAWRDVPLPEPG
jgi:hypothetical protein